MKYKNVELTCTEQKLKEFIETVKVEYKIHSFDEKYNNVEIENQTGNKDAKYYVLRIGNSVMLQPHNPYEMGFSAITEQNAETIINKHKQEVIDNIIISKFKITEEYKQVKSEERIAALEKSNIELMTMIATMATPTL